MKKILTIALLCAVCLSAKAQIKADADSLLLVRDYIIRIQEAVNSKAGAKEKVATLDSLIHRGTFYEGVLTRHLPAFVGGQEAETIYTSYKFIMGSAILYKTDSLAPGYKEPQGGTEDTRYINTRVPQVADKLKHYATHPRKP